MRSASSSRAELAGSCRRASSTDQRTVQGPKMPFWPASPSCQSTAAGSAGNPGAGVAARFAANTSASPRDERPAHDDRAVPEHLVPPAGLDRREARHDLVPPHCQHPAIPIQPPGMRDPLGCPPSRAWRRRRSPRPSGQGCARVSPDPEIPGNAQTPRADLCELHRPALARNRRRTGKAALRPIPRP